MPLLLISILTILLVFSCSNITNYDCVEINGRRGKVVLTSEQTKNHKYLVKFYDNKNPTMGSYDSDQIKECKK